MPSVHILSSSDPDVYNAVAHFAMVVGNNSAGVPWKTCYLASFNGNTPTSLLKVIGNGAGQITQQELNTIQSGDVIEVRFTFGDDTSLDATGRLALIDTYAARAVNDFKTNFAANFKYYGLTRP
jgi:hypothetical protein